MDATTAAAIAELQALTPSGQIDQYAMVKIENLDTEPVVWQYANRPWRIGSVNEAVNYNIVPWDLMVTYCGDPRTFDVPGDMRHRDRADQWQRLRTNYGIYDNLDLAETNLPKLKVTTISGLQITTVLDDPDGFGGDEVVVAWQQQEAQQETIARLEAQLAQVLAVADQQQKVIAAQNQNAMPAGDDHVTTVPVAPEQQMNPNQNVIPEADDVITASDLTAAFESQSDNPEADTDVATNVTPVGEGPKTPKPADDKPAPKPRTAGAPRKAGS